MGHELIIDVFRPLAIFGGIGLMVWISVTASLKARLASGTPDMMRGQPLKSQTESAVLAELKAMRQQMEQMQSTNNQFDLSFDEALHRMESRVSRLETKSAATASLAPEELPTLRNGQSL